MIGNGTPGETWNTERTKVTEFIAGQGRGSHWTCSNVLCIIDV